jgi:hypothetical protein
MRLGARLADEKLIAEASEGKLTHNSTTMARQAFGQAADDYVSARKLELAATSQAKEKQLLVQLRIYFKQEPLEIRSRRRASDAKRGAWHFAAGSKTGEDLGACCRRYTPSQRTQYDWASPDRGGQAAPSQNGCDAA